MDNSAKIVLVGMPGSGKSTLGKAAARQLGFDFYDLDEEIVKEEGRSIPEIFMDEGEGYFRRLETKVIQKLLSKDSSFLLSTGGGAPCFNENMELINQHGISVFLNVGIGQLLLRLTKNEADKRPMFRGMDTAEIRLKLQDLLADREMYYEQAKIMLSGDDISTEHLVSELMSFFRS
ncbi:shikimate kinase [Echinicola strongylocentroti]|uniref:Shikimate kinase n=1 Tax=Echinicola strongylocentroti TaxID=1795355 RepID=A0A2Z4IGY2_9BACT|nr:shikimate kinase [Echinicola strongylocentroti]AWW29930.1 shikimate kinase [Echinicola strongylocentroti]